MDNVEPGRILCVDFGECRLGLALSDPMRVIASPLKVITYKGTLKRAAHLVKEAQVAAGASLVLVGMPYSMDGRKGAMSALVSEFVAYLSTLVAVPVESWDERLSSSQAERALASGGMSSKKMRGQVDMVAAALILQSYMDSIGRAGQ